MRRVFRSVVLLVLFLALPCAAQQRKFLMWKVSSPTATVYIVGSIHLADPSIFPLPKPVETAFAESKALAVEADVSNVNMEDAIGMVGTYGMYTNGDSLAKHLTGGTQAALEKFCEKAGLPMELLETMRPWLVALLVEAQAATQSGFDASSGIDMHFLQEAQSGGQRIDQLESVEFQFKLLASASDDEQQEFLAGALKGSDDIKETERAYEAGDVGALASDISKQEPRGFYQRLIEGRNPAMTEKVIGYLNGHETVFVVVGMAHVIGENGIVRSLEKKSYKVEQGTYAW